MNLTQILKSSRNFYRFDFLVNALLVTVKINELKLSSSMSKVSKLIGKQTRTIFGTSSIIMSLNIVGEIVAKRTPILYKKVTSLAAISILLSQDDDGPYSHDNLPQTRAELFTNCERDVNVML